MPYFPRRGKKGDGLSQSCLGLALCLLRPCSSLQIFIQWDLGHTKSQTAPKVQERHRYLHTDVNTLNYFVCVEVVPRGTSQGLRPIVLDIAHAHTIRLSLHDSCFSIGRAPGF